MSSYRHSAAVAMIAIALATLGGCQSIQTQTTSLSPSVITLSMAKTKGIDPQNCNDWLSPSWQDPETWWRSLPASQPPRAGNHAVVGFNLLFDTQGGCRKFRQDLYRAGASYDLSQRQALRGLVTKAELTFSTDSPPPGVRANNLCQAFTGGGGSLIVVAPGATLPPANQGLAFLGSANAAAPFPFGSRLMSIPQPWISGAIGNNASSTATGQGGAVFTVDVTPQVIDRLDRGASAVQFMISGSDEATPTAFVPGPQDCRTVYKIGNLVLTHL